MQISQGEHHMSAIEKLIKQLRKQLFLEQSELSEKLGLSKTTIWHYENGTRMPRKSTIRKIIAFAKKNQVEFSINDFIEESKN